MLVFLDFSDGPLKDWDNNMLLFCLTKSISRAQMMFWLELDTSIVCNRLGQVTLDHTNKKQVEWPGKKEVGNRDTLRKKTLFLRHSNITGNGKSYT